MWDQAKRDVWAMEDRAEALATTGVMNRVRQTQLYRAALAHKDDLVEAHHALARHYRSVHRDAEVVGDETGAKRAEMVLKEHVQALPKASEARAEFRRYLRGKGTLSIHTQPSGADVSLVTLVSKDRRLTDGPVVSLGSSPIEGRTLEMGSYVVRIRHPGYHDAIYPVYNRRLEDINCLDPAGEPSPIPLLPKGTLGVDDCYVPGGWCWVGGDSRTPNSGPRLRVWVDGFVIRRSPVTHQEYLVFLNALVDQGEEALALKHVPREQSSSEGELGVMAYLRGGDGRFTLPDEPQRELCRPGQPVTMVQWSSARAYADWLSGQTGRPWRLPMEFEWEKAARGVDGRSYPWGDAFDPSWACIKDSHPGSIQMQDVDTFPLDVSIYGVRGTAGNTRDWCLDRFRETGPPLDSEQRLMMPTAEDLEDPGFKSSRGGSYGNSASRARSADRDWWFPERSYVGRGFRLAWGLRDSNAGN